MIRSSDRTFRRWWRFAAVTTLLCPALALMGCGSLVDLAAGDSDVEKLQADNKELRSENEKLQAEVQDLQAENEDLQAQVAGASADAETAGVESSKSTQDEVTKAEPSDGSSSGGTSGGGCSIKVAGPGDVSGDPVPGIKPDDLPLPAGAVIDYVDEGDYNFSLDFLLDSELESIQTFYEEQLQAQGWKEVDRTEYEQDGLKGIDTSWERGTYIPKGSPNDSDYEQTDETLSLTLQEIEPSGVTGRLLWNSYKMLDETN